MKILTVAALAAAVLVLSADCLVNRKRKAQCDTPAKNDKKTVPSAAASTAPSDQPKLVGETVLMKAGTEAYGVWRARLWTLRLSPDGEHLLFARRAPSKLAPTTQPGQPSTRPRWRYQVVLRHWKSGREKIVPIPLLVDVDDLLITAFSTNPFSADGKLLVVPAAVDANADGIWAERKEKLQPAIYDIASGNLTRIDIKGEWMVATFDSSGKRLIFLVVESMRPLRGKMYVTPADKIKLKALKTWGLPRSPSPTGSTLALVELHQPPEGRPVPKSVLYDFVKDTRVGELPIHERNAYSLKDHAPQWTADGRYLYYVDGEMVPDGEGTRHGLFSRVWDTKQNKQVAKISDFVVVGPRGGSTTRICACMITFKVAVGPCGGSTTMVLTKREGGGVFFHDAKTGKEEALATEAGIHPISVTGKYLIYVRKNEKGDQIVCRAQIKAGSK